MSFSVVSDGRIVVPGLDEGWNALVAKALDPGSVGGALGEAIGVFAGIFARHLGDPANARRWCVSFSETFASMCIRRRIPAVAVDGFLPVGIPPFDEQAAVHTAVRAAAAPRQPGDAGSLVVDWTGRQFDKVVTLNYRVAISSGVP